MSAQQSTLAAPPPAVHADSHDGLDAAGDGTGQPIEGPAADAHPLPVVATADLADLLANGQWGDGAHEFNPSIADAHAYDGHVALALDTGALPDINFTLDLLTSSHHLFDVPALDVSPGSDDASST